MKSFDGCFGEFALYLQVLAVCILVMCMILYDNGIGSVLVVALWKPMSQESSKVRIE